MNEEKPPVSLRVRILQSLEIIDAALIFNRIAVVSLTILYIIFFMDFWHWFKTSDFSEYKGLDFAVIVGVPGSMLTALGGIITSMWGKYFENGRNWKEHPPQ